MLPNSTDGRGGERGERCRCSADGSCESWKALSVCYLILTVILPYSRVYLNMWKQKLREVNLPLKIAQLASGRAGTENQASLILMP